MLCRLPVRGQEQQVIEFFILRCLVEHLPGRVAEEAEEEAKNKKPDSSPKKAPKVKKTFFPPDHLFKYELQEIEPDNPEDNPVSKFYSSKKSYFSL